MSARPVQVFAAAGAAPLLAAGASTQDPLPLVNCFATVRSADGYLNLRAARSSSSAIEARIPNGVQVLVGYCAAGRAGRRWCMVQRGAYRDTNAYTPGYAVDGWVYDAELVYAPARQTLHDSMAGAGVRRGLLPNAMAGIGTVRSDDGYTNLRSGPGTRYPVLRRVPNETMVLLHACQAGTARALWCLAVVDADTDPQSPSGQIGYIYYAELSTF